MSLSKYQKKRKFDQTPEPKGDVSKKIAGPLTFVVQKHRATRLHYDFRLEMEGVLKSWAVPRGPSLNPQDKRLAVAVEDHPIDYAQFEGIIPKKNYGAGTVMIWDQGVYSPIESVKRAEAEKILLKQLKEGHLTFILLGQKLKGEFALVKANNAEENVWFLIKAGDEYASYKDILEEDKSVVSKRTLEQIAKNAEKEDKVWVSKPKNLDIKAGKVSKMPEGVHPMLASSVEKPFSDKDWIYEIKWDGYRTIAEVKSGKIKLYSRNGISFDQKFAEVLNSLKKFPGSAVLDGEVVVLDRYGRPNFQLLQDYPKLGGRLSYQLFDILYFDGRNLMELPLLERKKILQSLIPENEFLKFSDHVESEGAAFYEQVKKMHLEGVMAKKADSIYQRGVRSKDWLKIKTQKTEDVVIGGFTRGRGSRSYFGSLVVGQYVGKKLIYRGHVGGGFNERKLKDIYEKLSKISSVNCPFDEEPVTNEKVIWVHPKLSCEVSFSNWTNEKIMRHPLFVKMVESEEDTPHLFEPEPQSRRPGPLPKQSLRSNDLKEREINEEVRVFSKEGPSKSEGVEIKIGARKITISNPDKVFWPGENLKKLDVIEYYRQMAHFILPYLKDRPQSLLRYPNGILEDGFFQKDASNLKTDWLMRVQIKSEDKKTEFLLCPDEASLIYMANLGCIDFHPWHSTVEKIEKPDYLIIDLDPEDVPFSGVVKAALKVRDFLEKLEVESFVKTSGSRGIHIFVPMGGNYDHEQVKMFAELLCNHIQVEMPELMSVRRNPADRQKKVYLDYLQNGRGKTLASVYSVRPKKGAFVSTPLEWNEVNEKLHPSMFTMKNLLKRVEKKGDLFKGVLGKGLEIKLVLSKLEGI